MNNEKYGQGTHYMKIFLREKLGEMMTLFHTVAFCGHLWQCFKKMANLVHKIYIFSFGNIMPGTEKLWGELLFPEEKCFFVLDKFEGM